MGQPQQTAETDLACVPRDRRIAWMPEVNSLAHQCYAVTRDLLHARAGLALASVDRAAYRRDVAAVRACRMLLTV